ncbi:hypothetical protein EON81_11285 [bacterium]|nr:MAG: hypothetical protein EON81_11285 [bacterium]
MRKIRLFFLSQLGYNVPCAGICCSPSGRCRTIALRCWLSVLWQCTVTDELTSRIYRWTQSVQRYFRFIGVPLSYRDGRQMEIPTLRYLARTPDEIREIAERIGVGEIAASESEVGAGSAPGTSLPTLCLALDPKWAQPLRTGHPAIVGRISGGRLLLDPRTLDEAEIPVVKDRLESLVR